MADEQKTQGGSGAKADDGAFQQAKADTLTSEQKHKNYLADLERLHKESVVDSLGHTPRAG